MPRWREEILQRANDCSLKGTVLLSTEGINVFVAGERPGIEAFKAYLESIPLFKDLPYKESFSEKKVSKQAD